MKKEIKKFLVILFASLFTLVALCFTASANSETETTVTDYGGEISTDETDGTLNQNIFEIIYREGIKHSDKILSLLAFVTSLILALSYKKSLIPFIKGALSKLGSSVNKITEDSESKTDKAMMTGRTDTAKIVNFAGESALTGKYINVKITKAQTWSLYGEVVDE